MFWGSFSRGIQSEATSAEAVPGAGLTLIDIAPGCKLYFWFLKIVYKQHHWLSSMICLFFLTFYGNSCYKFCFSMICIFDIAILC